MLEKLEKRKFKNIFHTPAHYDLALLLQDENDKWWMIGGQSSGKYEMVGPFDSPNPYFVDANHTVWFKAVE